ncbi:DUF892 family protein [Belliella marina]|uniref:DUF892 family protein n=1 Tax=Belliella marina TaxID=1644146 RepID=A0ABW4VPH6_9BACT
MIFQDAPSPNHPYHSQNNDINLWFMYKCMEIYHGEMKILKCVNSLKPRHENPLLSDLLLKYSHVKSQQIENLGKIFLIIDLPLEGKKSPIIDFLVDECVRYKSLFPQNFEGHYHLSQTLLAINVVVQNSYSWISDMVQDSNLEDLSELVTANLELENNVGIQLMDWSTSFDR